MLQREVAFLPAEGQERRFPAEVDIVRVGAKRGVQELAGATTSALVVREQGELDPGHRASWAQAKRGLELDARLFVRHRLKRRLVRPPEEDVESGVPRIPREGALELDGGRRAPAEILGDGRSDDASSEPCGEGHRQDGDEDPAPSRLETYQQESV